MRPTICTRCKKNVAVIFITKVENGKSSNEGLCLKCAKELKIGPVEDLMQRLNLTDEDLDNITDEMVEAMSGMESMLAGRDDMDMDEEDEGRTATFPFLNKLFGNGGGDDSPAEPPVNPWINPPMSGDPKKPKGKDSKKNKYLENYSINLTDRARSGLLDKLVGREKEIERVVQILNRRQKNNPCLIGEPGVGKTAIAEGLAKRIVDGKVPFKLQNKEVYLLDLTALVAGTQFRGQFEARMKGLIEEVKKKGNVILVIDEVHNLVGAGESEGAMNAANILKPALSRGEIQVIGATTFNEYRKSIEKDSALERRFQPVTVVEPSIDDSIKIIMGIKEYYENYHSVIIPDDIAKQIVILSERYITDRFLPDKAIDLMDEACSDLNLTSPIISKRDALMKERDDVTKEREMLLSKAVDSNDYARLAELRSADMRLTEQIAELDREGLPCLGADNLARVIELWTHIPASNIKEDEFKRLNELDKRLRAHIVGQDEAVDAVCAAIRRNRVGISPKRKPVSFIFIGSTGVGKTELVKRLAEDMFDSPESLIRLDMSEFMEKHTVSRLVGSPPGYVGYDEAGQLTEKIRRKPYSVVLFDEIEKAHPDVMNILLQILDDGRVTDAHGRIVNFENTIIIMTTNAGSNSKEATVGFNRTVNEQNKDKAMKALNNFLRPEFINRVDEVVHFNHLTEENFMDIAKLMLTELRDAMKDKNMNLIWNDEVLQWLRDKAYSIAYGARNLRRTIQKEIEDRIASAIITNYEQKFTQIGLSVEDGELKVLTM
ncbi:MAG: ATP-dependent Clp protease ATP-binding subunit [Oscillospiraceae bacterium]|nr:ATP-dependent Clp protease ATP-binding subunit [Oscillospiraceae bacterium]